MPFPNIWPGDKVRCWRSKPPGFSSSSWFFSLLLDLEMIADKNEAPMRNQSHIFHLNLKDKILRFWRACNTLEHERNWNLGTWTSPTICRKISQMSNPKRCLNESHGILRGGRECKSLIFPISFRRNPPPKQNDHFPESSRKKMHETKHFWVKRGAHEWECAGKMKACFFTLSCCWRSPIVKKHEKCTASEAVSQVSWSDLPWNSKQYI